MKVNDFLGPWNSIMVHFGPV